MISYLPTLKDSKGNKFVGLMGQFDDYDEAMNKLYGDFIYWIPFGLTTAGIKEFDTEVGLLNAPVEIDTPQMGKMECAVIAGPLFDEAVERAADEQTEES